MKDLFAKPLQAGDSWSFEFSSIVDRDGAPVTDLTGWSARFTLRPKQTAPITVQAAGTISGAKFTWEIPQAATAPVAPGAYIGDIEITDPSGRVATPARGIISITADPSP